MELRIKVKVNIGTLKSADVLLRQMQTASPPPPVREMYSQWLHRYERFTRRRFLLFSRGGGDWPPLALKTVRARRKPSKQQAARERTIRTVQRFGFIEGIGPQYLARDTRRGGALVQQSRKTSILIDSSALIKSITIGNSGNRVYFIEGGVRYGFSDAAHPEAAPKRLIDIRGRRGSAKRRRDIVRQIRRNLRGSAPITMARLATIHHRGLGRVPVRRILAEPDEATLRGMKSDARRAIRAIFKIGGGS